MSGALSMRERVPDYHYASEQSKALIETLEDASLEAKAALEDVMAQFFINTATWGLALWEQQVGIETDNSLSLSRADLQFCRNWWPAAIPLRR